MKTLAAAVMAVTNRMMQGGITGNQAWQALLHAADNATLLAWSRDALLREPGCGYIGEHIASEMKRRIDAAPPPAPLAITIIDYSAKR